MNRASLLRAMLGAAAAALAACGGEDGLSEAEKLAQFCTTKAFTPPAQSPYRLPYAVGSTYVMFQGNCPVNPAWGHHGMFAYDFEMPLGTPVYAMRAGTVTFTESRYANDDHTPGHENTVWLRHDDGTVSVYAHFSPAAVMVLVGAAVQAGDQLGLSGHSGASDRPHLHVQAYATAMRFEKQDSVPITFVNADGPLRPTGELIQDNAYTALPVP
jgi:murein DD-endopeptidase MepM/ murein hydrolase activator NlpD